jgi:coenzyme F420 hydrogenase subunit beta
MTTPERSIPGHKGKSVALSKLSIGLTEHTLCTRCGTCVGVCPVMAIEFDKDLYPSLIGNRCVECGLCARTCPGAQVRFAELGLTVFGHDRPAESFDGHVRDTWVGYATDEGIRRGGAGGGIVTGLLWDLLKNGVVQGCVVTRMNREKPWVGEPFIARTYDDLLESQGSRYLIIPLNQTLAEIRKSPGRIAIAALPCQIHGIRKAMQALPELAEKIYLVVGLFCGGSLEPYVVTELLEARGISPDQVAGFEFRGGEWPGRIRATTKDGKVRNLHYSNYKDGAYNYFISMYMPVRCQTCMDGSNEFSDISVSDAWTRDEQGEYKFNSQSKILVRTKRGEEALQAAIERGSISAQSLSKDPSYRTHKFQTQRKGLNAPLRVERWRRKGIPVPDCDRNAPIHTRKEALMERTVTGLLWLGRYRWIRFPIMKFLTSFCAIPLIQIRLWLKKRKYQRKKTGK